MAARKNKGTKDRPWDEKTREKIQTSMLLNALQDHVLGKNKMKTTQIRAAEILLKKSLPDLAVLGLSIDFDAEGENLVTQAIRHVTGQTKGLPDIDGKAG